MKIDEIVKSKRICVCCGSGGVGKTTSAAAVALGAAMAGKRVAVVTIDPARRLADALGLERLENEPRLINPERFANHDIQVKGELWAMTLDVKRTFDDLICRLAPDPQTRDQILSNRIYQQLSTAVAGSQEFTAIAKLYELSETGMFDLIVLDTPPSRNALDFLDAPDRLTNFFEGRALKTLLKPTGIGMRVLGRGTGVVFRVLQRVTGVDLIGDLQIFFQALSGLLDDFKVRAKQVEAILHDPATTFLLVTSPEREPIDEAIFFWRKLKAAKMPFGGIIVNRLHSEFLNTTTMEHLSSQLSATFSPDLSARIVSNFADYQMLVQRDQTNLQYLIDTLAIDQLITVPQFDRDIYDIEGLIKIQRCLFN